MTERRPPFSLGAGATNYRRIDPDRDALARNPKYLQQRSDLDAALRLSAHDPRVWRVSVPAGEGTHKDTTLVRCEACGIWARVSKRSVRKGVYFDPSGVKLKGDLAMCVPVSERDLKSLAYAKERKEKLMMRGVLGVMFALLALAPVLPTMEAPSDKRIYGILAILLWGAVSAGFWWSFFDIRSRR